MRRIAREIRSQWMGALALFVALGGSAYAAATITSSDIVDGTISKVDLGARVVGPNALGEVPNLRLWGSRSDQPWDCGQFNDIHFANASGNWGEQYLTSTRSRTGIPRAGQYLITAHMVLPRIVARAASGGCGNGRASPRWDTRSDINPRIRIVVYTPSGGSRVLDEDDIESGWDLEPDVYALRLHATAVDRLAPGERVALKFAVSGFKVNGVEDTPRLTITWLGN